MAGLTAAWRLSEPGWEEQFESITVYQRGWRLGGKGASSRGVHGRIEEHGLHVWFGWYENAFRLLRECYAELDRTVRDPECPVGTLSDALIPSGVISLAECRGGALGHWTTHMPSNERSSAGSEMAGRELTAVDFSAQAVKLIARYFEGTVRGSDSDGFDTVRTTAAGVAVSATALVAEAARLAGLWTSPARCRVRRVRTGHVGRRRAPGGSRIRWSRHSSDMAGGRAHVGRRPGDLG